MDARVTRTCYFRYDPGGDVAVLGFGDAYPTAGGQALEITDGAKMPGLIRLAPNGQFTHLELLGASRGVPRLVSQLDIPEPAPRQMFEGEVEVTVTTAEDQSWVRIDLIAAESGTDQEFTAFMPSGALAATLTRQPAGALHSLTLHASGRLLEPLLEAARTGRSGNEPVGS